LFEVRKTLSDGTGRGIEYERRIGPALSFWTAATQMKSVDQLRELSSPTDPSDFKWGTIIGWALAVLGGIAGVLGVIFTLQIPWAVQRDRLLMIVAIVTLTGLIAGSGILLIRKAKLGLWGLYVLSAWFAIDTLYHLARGLVAEIGGGRQSAFLDMAFFLVWLAIVQYFHNRRRLFTRLWGSASAVVAGK
jgi:hypothetical protein